MKTLLIALIVVAVAATIYELWKLHKDCKDLDTKL